VVVIVSKWGWQKPKENTQKPKIKVGKITLTNTCSNSGLVGEQ